MKIRRPTFLEAPIAPMKARARVVRQVIGYLGPGFFVTVGFIDPGNWATNIAAGDGPVRQ